MARLRAVVAIARHESFEIEDITISLAATCVSPLGRNKAQITSTYCTIESSGRLAGREFLVARLDAVHHEHTRVVHPALRQSRVATDAQLSDCVTAGF